MRGLEEGGKLTGLRMGKKDEREMEMMMGRRSWKEKSWMREKWKEEWMRIKPDHLQ